MQIVKHLMHVYVCVYAVQFFPLRGIHNMVFFAAPRISNIKSILVWGLINYLSLQQEDRQTDIHTKDWLDWSCSKKGKINDDQSVKILLKQLLAKTISLHILLRTHFIVKNNNYDLFYFFLFILSSCTSRPALCVCCKWKQIECAYNKYSLVSKFN